MLVLLSIHRTPNSNLYLNQQDASKRMKLTAVVLNEFRITIGILINVYNYN